MLVPLERKPGPEALRSVPAVPGAPGPGRDRARRCWWEALVLPRALLEFLGISVQVVGTLCPYCHSWEPPEGRAGEVGML